MHYIIGYPRCCLASVVKSLNFIACTNSMAIDQSYTEIFHNLIYQLFSSSFHPISRLIQSGAVPWVVISLFKCIQNKDLSHRSDACTIFVTTESCQDDSPNYVFHRTDWSRELQFVCASSCERCIVEDHCSITALFSFMGEPRMINLDSEQKI